MNRKDMAGGFVLLAIAIAYFYFAAQIQSGALSDNTGPAGVPKALAVLLGAVAVAMIARAALHRPVASDAPAAERSEPGEDYQAPFPRAAGFALIAFAYIALVAWLGYVISIALLIIAISLYEGKALSLRMASVAAAGAVFFYLLFVKLLGVSMPAGILRMPF